MAWLWHVRLLYQRPGYLEQIWEACFSGMVEVEHEEEVK